MIPEQIRRTLESYLSPLPEKIEHKVHKYLDLLQLWGRHIPLTSISDPEELVRFHFGESIFALSTGGMEEGRLADVGTGPGFPGLALKLASPRLSITLIEPNKKKCAFLHEVVRSLELESVEIRSTGFGSSRIELSTLSFITSRALGQHKAMLDWASTKLRTGGGVLLWVGQEDAAKISRNVEWEWCPRLLIPGTRERFLLRGRKII